MPEYLSPGVYVEELSGPKPIEGVGTSTGAFVGIAERGPINSAQLITNLTQFTDTFGGFLPKAHLAYAVQHFFTEGGTRCFVVRAFKPSAAPSGGDPTPDLARVNMMGGSPPANVMQVRAASVGAWGNSISVRAGKPGFDPNETNPATTKKFKLEVFYKSDPAPVEVFDGLSMAEFDGATGLPNPNHVEMRINGVSKYITVVDASTNPAQIDPPTFLNNSTALTLGTDGLPAGSAQSTNMLPADLIGSVSSASTPASGLHAFDTIEEINIVAIPELVNPAFAQADARSATLAGFGYCELRKDCFFVADTPQGMSPLGALGYKRGVAPDGTNLGSAFNSKYGALYYPWIYATDPLTGKRKLLPPSGAVAGSYSASDVRVGVHKAPAGIDDGYLNSAVDVERVLTKGEHDVLNPEGVNAIRKFADAGVVIWGARTVSADSEWKYINVRRLFIFLESSLLKGTQGVVFEPNDRSLWKRIERDVGAFLRVQWREGKLVGDKPEKAFFVKCDEETNPPESVDLGRVITLIGVAPSKPAEFVIFRIRQTRSGGGAEE
jgi:phage tail sheath protein FI